MSNYIKIIFSKNSIQKFLLKMLVSMIISAIITGISILESNPIKFFAFLTFINYVSIATILNIFSFGVSPLFDKISNGLLQIQDEYLFSHEDLSDEKKEILNYKFIQVREKYLKGNLSLRYLRTNFYNPEAEFTRFMEYIDTTVKAYKEDWCKADLRKECQDTFHKIHQPATEKFAQNMKICIFEEKSIAKRRKIFHNELLLLMKSSVDDFAVATTSNQKI